MYKVSVVGIDNSGKTSVVNSLHGSESLKTIHLTDCLSNPTMPLFSLTLSKLVVFSEKYNHKRMAGFLYFTHLAPYFFEEKKSLGSVLVSDRDPIIDTLCYCDFYSPRPLLRVIKPPLRYFLEYFFNYPDLFIYLNVSPEISVRRSSEVRQLHERVSSLSRLKELLEGELFRLGRMGIGIIRIDTDKKSLAEVEEEVKYHVLKKVQ